MYTIGTEVEVVLSSVDSKKTGPRVGSIGFMSEEFHNWWFDDLEIHIGIEDSLVFSIIVSLSNIVFLRYGNEQKYRKEVKQVILVQPIRHSRNFFEAFKKYPQQFLDSISNIIGIASHPLIVVKKVDCKHSLQAQQYHEAWLESILQSEGIKRNIYSILQSKYGKALKKAGLQKLYECGFNKDMKYKYMFGNISKEARLHNINLILMVLAHIRIIKQKRYIDDTEIKLNSNYYGKGNKIINSRALTRLLISYKLKNERLFEITSALMIEKYTDNILLSKIIAQCSDMSEELKALSSSTD